MAGTEFTRPALLGAVRGNYDRRIAELAQEINELNSLTIEERHTAWRASAEARLSDLFRRVNEATDAELAGFRIEQPPRPDDFRYRIRALDDQIDALQRAKEKALSYVSALAATDSGIVTLNAADLRRIGYGL